MIFDVFLGAIILIERD